MKKVFSSIKNFFKNKYVQMSIMIICAVFVTITVALSVAALKTVPDEFLPLIRSLVAFMVMGMVAMIVLGIMFILVGKNNIITSEISEITATLLPILDESGASSGAAVSNIQAENIPTEQADTDQPPQG